MSLPLRLSTTTPQPQPQKRHTASVFVMESLLYGSFTFAAQPAIDRSDPLAAALAIAMAVAFKNVLREMSAMLVPPFSCCFSAKPPPKLVTSSIALPRWAG